MGSWIGPAIVAALISGLVSLIGLYLGGWIAIRHEKRRRREKVRDFQIALRAEIRSELQIWLQSISMGTLPRLEQLDAGRQLEMYKDYIGMQKYLAETARLSIKALDRSLGEHSYFSSPAWVQSDR